MDLPLSVLSQLTATLDHAGIRLQKALADVQEDSGT